MQDLEYLKEWIGRTERGTDYVTIPLVHRLAATLDRDDPKSDAPPAPPQPAPGSAVWSKTTTPDHVMLFRLSALVFNGHRIHTDHPYVTKVEGYPNLVVPGSLHTLLMLELVRAHKPDVRYRSIAWRNVRPLFVDRPLTACGEPSRDGRSAKLWVMDAENALALSADAQFH